MPNKIDLTGKKFGKLTVLHEDTPIHTSGGHSVVRWYASVTVEMLYLLEVENSEQGTLQVVDAQNPPILPEKDLEN